MITAITKSAPTDCVPAWHRQFLSMLPAIRRHATIAFRHLPDVAREDAIAEVVVNCVAAYARLAELSKADIAYPSVLARFAIRQYRDGRRVGNRLNVHDVMSKHCRLRKGVVVERLDCLDEREDGWREAVVEDRRANPANVAAARIDIAAWFDQLPARKRKIAKALAAGERTGDVAKQFGLSAGRVSQLRVELRDSWATFQGELPVTVKTTARLA